MYVFEPADPQLTAAHERASATSIQEKKAGGTHSPVSTLLTAHRMGERAKRNAPKTSSAKAVKQGLNRNILNRNDLNQIMHA